VAVAAEAALGQRDHVHLRARFPQLGVELQPVGADGGPAGVLLDEIAVERQQGDAAQRRERLGRGFAETRRLHQQQGAHPPGSACAARNAKNPC
jgi:hypothetical protein